MTSMATLEARTRCSPSQCILDPRGPLTSVTPRAVTYPAVSDHTLVDRYCRMAVATAPNTAAVGPSPGQLRLALLSTLPTWRRDHDVVAPHDR
jgi:hypothetical protein